MKQPKRPLVFTVDEFARKVRIGVQPVMIYYTQKQFERAVQGMKPVVDRNLCGPGLYVIPIPGGPGYVAFPVCWPDEVPVLGGKGSIRCVPSAFETAEEKREPLGKECAVRISPLGIPHCAGECPQGGRCSRVYSLIGGSFFFGCQCRRRLQLSRRRVVRATVLEK